MLCRRIILINLYKKKLFIIHDTLFWETEYAKRFIYKSIGKEIFENLFFIMDAIEVVLNKNKKKNFVKYTIDALTEHVNHFGRLSDEHRTLLHTYISHIARGGYYSLPVFFDGYKKFQDLFISSSLKDISYIKNNHLFDDCFRLLFFSHEYGYYPDTILRFFDQRFIIETINNNGLLPSPPIVLPTVLTRLNSDIFNRFILHECGIIVQKPKSLSTIEKKHNKEYIEKQISEKITRFKDKKYKLDYIKYLSFIKKIVISGDYDSLKITEKEELLDLYMKIKFIKNTDVRSLSRAQGLFIWDYKNITNEYESNVDAINKLKALLDKMKIKKQSERFYTDKYYCTKQCIKLGKVLPISGANQKEMGRYEYESIMFGILNMDPVFQESWGSELKKAEG